MVFEAASGLERLLVVRPRRLIWKSCEDGCLCFDMDSGDTKLVSPLARFLMDQLGASSSGMSVAALVDLVHAEEPEVDVHSCRDEVSETLETLLAAGLLQTAARAS